MANWDVTIAGEINLDLVLYGLPEDIPLERELLASDFKLTLGSSSAITAHNLAALGLRVGFITRVGPDELGELALKRLAESGVDLTRVVRSANPPNTGVTVILHHGEKRRILTHLGTIAELTCKDLDVDYLAAARHFHFSSLFLQKGLAPDLPQLFWDLKRAGLTISLDTNDDPDDVWDGKLDQLLDSIDLLLPNEREACQIARRYTIEEAVQELATRVPCVAVKLGHRGALVRCGDTQTYVPGLPVEAKDTIGAGDSFNAGFLAAWLRGASCEDSAMAGNVTGALSTLRPGGTEAFRDDALRREFLNRHTAVLRSTP